MLNKALCAFSPWVVSLWPDLGPSCCNQSNPLSRTCVGEKTRHRARCATQELSLSRQVGERSAHVHITLLFVAGCEQKVATTLYHHSSPVSCVGAQRPSWMNEWVGPDINVAGPLEMPPSDEFSITESTHLFGEFSKYASTHGRPLTIEEEEEEEAATLLSRSLV